MTITQDKHDFLCKLPKCEHHVHLEGTLAPELLFKLASRNEITLPDHFPSTPLDCYERYDNFKDLQDFLDHYYIGMSVLITEEDFHDLAIAYFTRAHSEGLRHVEAFFDPQGHLERGIDIHTIVMGLSSACKKAELELGISTKLIMCLLRHLPNSDGVNTIELTKKYYADDLIHGLGLDSSEIPFPPELFKESYEMMAREFPNVGLTAHAGEEAGPDYVHNALNHLNVQRIDHGIQSVNDPKLIERLSKERIMLSVCPISNLKLQVVKDIADLPIRALFEADVPFSLNSDDPAYFGGYLLDNYLAVDEKFNFTVQEWVKIAHNAVNGSWIDEKRRLELLNEIELVSAEYQHLI